MTGSAQDPAERGRGRGDREALGVGKTLVGPVGMVEEASVRTPGGPWELGLEWGACEPWGVTWVVVQPKRRALAQS